MYEEPTEEQKEQRRDEELQILRCKMNWAENVKKILAEYSPYLRKHKLISHDGKELNEQVKVVMGWRTYVEQKPLLPNETLFEKEFSQHKSLETGIAFKIELLKMLINYGEEDLQDELDALEGTAGEELIDEEVAKQKRLAKRLAKLVEAEVEAKRQYYTESVKRFKEYEIEILSLVEIGTLTQEEADKKLEEARRHTEQELKNINKRS